MSHNKLSLLFKQKLSILVDTCQGAYWNSTRSGFVIVDFSKLQQKIIGIWGHHLRTFLKKLLAYGFKRQQIFDGVQYIHSSLTNKNTIHDSDMKLEEISMEEKLKQQEYIISRVHNLTQLIQQNNEQEEQNINQTKKKLGNWNKILNKTMFKVLSQGKDMDKLQVKKNIERLKEGVRQTKQKLQLSFKRLKESLEEENQVVGLMREPEEKQEQIGESMLDLMTPIKAEEENYDD